MDDARRADETGMGVEGFWRLGTARVGERIVSSARVAAAMHGAMSRDEEGVSVEERLALLEGAL